MIGRLHGTLVAKMPPQVLIDVHGVGYEVDVPMSTFYDLPETGHPVTLLTHQVIREDANLLYGFLTDDERSAFRSLIKITGVGPKLALSVLSGLTVRDLADIITRQEAGRLQKVPGIGKKTAERLLLELKGKLTLGASALKGGPAPNQQQDILEALLALGYTDREVQATLKALPEGITVSDGIRQALKLLSK